MNGSSRPAADSRECLRLWLRLLLTSAAVARRLKASLADAFGTSLSRFEIMAVLARAPSGLTRRELCGELLIANGAPPNVLRRLVAEGIVEQSPRQGPSRASILSLTPAGRRAFQAMAAQHQAWIADAMSRAPADRLASLSAGLDLVRRSAEDLGA